MKAINIVGIHKQIGNCFNTLKNKQYIYEPRLKMKRFYYSFSNRGKYHVY